jgi:hypothetical protein
MSSRLDVSPFLLSAISSNRSARDSRTEMALSLRSFCRFFLLLPFSALARTGAERAPRFEWDM